MSSNRSPNLYGHLSTSYWIESTGMEDGPLLAPLQGDIKADLVIIGGGYTGLATAYYFSERYPDKKVVILEGARVGYGASGRNDGLVLPLINGSEQIIEDLLEKGSIEQAREIFDKTSTGIDLIEEIIGQHGIECEWEPCSCLIGAVTDSQVRTVEKKHAFYRSLGLGSELLGPTDLQRRAYISYFKAAHTVPMGGMINPARLARGMLPLLMGRDVSVHEGSRAMEIVNGERLTVRTPSGSVTAPALVLATNAYTSRLGFFRNRVTPVHSYSIATEPLSERQLEALNWQDRQPIFDVRNFFELFRLAADNRIIFSGGDAHYYYNDRLDEAEDNPDYKRLKRALVRRFPMLEDLAITHQWPGRVGLTLDMSPAVGVMGSSSNVYYGLGYSGHGVPVSFLVGKLICDLYAGEPIDPAYSFFFNRRPPLAPPEPLKSIGFALYKRYLRFKDLR